MPLSPGTKLGRYDILSFVGAGGMGEVYRARDTGLGRDVAVKVLRNTGSGDGARRLTREARAASALNHPNIAIVHDVAAIDGVTFIVMELVDGRPLSALVRDGLNLDEALRIAIAVADALARAHAAGVVHRDLKPANVVVSQAGVPKVLDFGIAKQIDPPASHEDDTATERTSPVAQWTSGGGTPGYVAPEQVTGGRVDARSDIFSFGSLLYELITGRRAFQGASAAETIGKVLAEQPRPPREIAPAIPVELEQAVLRCLRKEPDRRFQSMADVKVVLQDIADARADSGGIATPAGPGRRVARWPIALAAGAAMLAAIAFAWRARPGGDAVRPFDVAPLTTTSGIESGATFSPDATQVAYTWEGETRAKDGSTNFDVWIRLVGGSDARRLTSSPLDDLAPSWSPDGRHIAFQRGRIGEPGTIYVVSPLGGLERPLATLKAARPETTWLRGAVASQLAWTPDSRYVAVAREPEGSDTPSAGGIHLVALDGGDARALTTPAAPALHRDPVFSPDGRRLAYATCASNWYAACDVYVLDLDAGYVPRPPARRLTQHDLSIVGLAWTRDGRSLVFGGPRFNRSHLWRVPADGSAAPARLDIARLGLAPAIAGRGDRLAFTVTLADMDVYAFEPGRPDTVVTASTLGDFGPAFAPDGRRFAFESARAGESDEIWLADADGSHSVQLTRGPGVWQGSPAWSPDGKLIAFDSRGGDGFSDIWVIAPDGSGLRQVTQGALDDAHPTWSQDGKWIYFRDHRPDGHDLRRTPLAGGAPELVVQGGFRGFEAADGRTIVFTVRDDESPLVAQPLAGGERRTLADCVITRSVTRGPDGIYYVGCPAEAPEGDVYRLDVGTGVRRRLGTAGIGGGFVPGMTVAPDGRRILFTKQVGDGSDLMLVEGFR